MDLPELVLSRIISHLNLDLTEKFRLRLVCKRWKELIDFEIGAKTSLCVYDERFCRLDEPTCYPRRVRWPSNGRLIRHSEVLSQTLFENRLGHFGFIRRLALHRTRRQTFGHVEVLPKLVELLSGGLVELSLFLTGLLVEDPNAAIQLDRLSFPVLKCLRVKENFTEPLKIVAPELEKLILEHVIMCPHTIFFERFHNFESNPPIVLSHPEKLKHLECETVDRSTSGRFPDLEHLTVRGMQQPSFYLSDYRKLKRLDLWITNLRREPERMFEQFLEQKRRLGLNELTITHFGFKKYTAIQIGSMRWGLYPQLTNVLFLGRYTTNLVSNLSEFVDDHLDQRFGIALDRVDQDHLNVLDSLVGFFCRTNLVEFKVCRFSSKQPDHLIRFLRGVQGVEMLRFKECSFSQKFYEQLKSVPFILSLELENCSPIENFDFIADLNGILEFKFEFELGQNVLPLDSFFEAFRKLKLKHLQLRTCRFLLSLQRNSTSFLGWSNQDGRKQREFESPDDFYRFLQNDQTLKELFAKD